MSDPNPTPPAEPAAAPAVDPAATPPVEPAKAPEASVLGGAASPPIEGEPKKPEGAPAEPAPAFTLESYKDLAVPEGIQLDEKTMGGFKELALKHGVPPEAAAEFLAMHAEVATQGVAALQQQWVETQKNWTNEVLSWPEYQGERKAQTDAILGRVMEEYGTPEVRSVLNESGIGNNPHLVRFILNLAHGLVEGEPMTPGKVIPAKPNGQAGGPSRVGALFYPKSLDQ